MPDDLKSVNENPASEDTGEAFSRSTRERFTLQKTQRALQKSVGEPEDLIPFAWRNPIRLTEQKKFSKVLKKMAAAEKERMALVPAGEVEE